MQVKPLVPSRIILIDPSGLTATTAASLAMTAGAASIALSTGSLGIGLSALAVVLLATGAVGSPGLQAASATVAVSRTKDRLSIAFLPCEASEPITNGAVLAGPSSMTAPLPIDEVLP